jgi:hypothetical protein
MRVEAGAGLTLVPDLEPTPEVVLGEVVHDEAAPATPGTLAALREEMRTEMRAAVADIEFRLRQQYELMRRADGGAMDHVYVEDIDDGKHRITGYTVTANSPIAGSIAWASLHIVFLGVDWTIADGSTALKYTYFIKPGSGTTATLQSSNTQPVLSANDALIFVNNAGVPVSATETSVPPAVGPGSVGTSQIVDGAVTSTKTDFYSALATSITNAQNTADLAKATADGAIQTYFQATQPWAAGTSHTPDRIGDIWYDSDDGQAWRWSGNGGTWVMIEDSNIGAALAAANAAQGTANTKTTVFYAAQAAIPTSLSVNDTWVVTDQGNAVRHALIVGANTLANWPLSLFGDGAISDVGGAKVGTGINGSNVTTGTVLAARVGAGVAGAVLTSATGTVNGTQIAAGAVTPVKMNTAFHLLY